MSLFIREYKEAEGNAYRRVSQHKTTRDYAAELKAIADEATGRLSMTEPRDSMKRKPPKPLRHVQTITTRQASRRRRTIDATSHDRSAPPDRLILSRDDAAAYLGCTLYTLDNLVRSGVMPYRGPSSSIFFARVELDGWLAFWRQEATAETLIRLVWVDLRNHNVGFPGRLFLQGLLRPEERAKLPRRLVWPHDVIEDLVDEITRATIGSTMPSAVVGYVQADAQPSTRALTQQRQAISRWTQAGRISLVTIYEDAGISPTVPLDQRPGLQAAIAALTPGRALLAVEWDRLTTHLLTAVALQQRVMQAGAAIITVNDERERLAALPPQTVLLTLPAAFIEPLDRYIERQAKASPGKTMTRTAAGSRLLEQGLTRTEVEEHEA
jgi:Resolvase, N terminal domain